jgi:anthranilate phosphoribosyltransferase
MTPQAALQRVIEHREIFHDEMVSLMQQIMGGEVTPVMIAAIITGLRVKKETIGEIAAAATVMRELSTKVDRRHQSPGRYLRHRGRRRPYLQYLHRCHVCCRRRRGADRQARRPLRLQPVGQRRCARSARRQHQSQSGASRPIIAETGVGFMFAPNHHSAMKHAAPVRRELGVRTIFNILGPLTNPANAPQQVMGVFHPDLVGILVRVLQRLGSTRALTVFGREGLDEISISGQTLVGELKDGRVSEYEIHPEQFNLPVHDPKVLQVANVEESKIMLLGALENKIGAARDIVALNAGASIYVCGLAETLADGVEQAFEMIASGAARQKLDTFVSLTRKLTV